MARRKRTAAEKRRAATEARGSEPRVQLLSPTPDQPFMRRYVPSEADAARLGRSGVLDWRHHPPAAPLASVDGVADHIICADAEAALSLLPEASVACIITSPPYWNFVDYGVEGQIGAGSYESYLEELLRVWCACERVLQPNGKLCINTPILPIPKAVMSEQHTRHLKNLSNDIETTLLGHLSLERFSLYVWQKQTTEKMFGSYPYPPNLFEQNTIEFINVFVKPGRPRVLPAEVKEASRLTETQWLNLTRQVWHLYPEDIRRAQHPAPFPEALANRLIALYTFAGAPEHGFPGDIVLDPFNGTGATCVAARRLGRPYIGIDLAPDFCVEAAKRLERTEYDGRIFICLPDRPSKTSAAELESEGGEDPGDQLA